MARRLNAPYMAGIVDGEGCILFRRLRFGVYPSVLVVNTNRQLIDEIHQTFGGNVFPVCHRKPHWKPSYEWRLQWSRCVAFLAWISPWLRVKQLQAQTVFAWDAMRPGRGNWRDENENAELRDFFIARMHWLNRRGIDDGSPDPVDVVLAEMQNEGA